ncbi:hypothetical protein SLS62_004767 [Diatrype stigma]|uniref:Ornithine cyclodeaminase n=1 Tax=Diatrype stigma TaxID=117547 RepID=A0AAN9V4B8_9PEZI
MSFTVLSDSDVKSLLAGLSTADATQLLDVLGQALVQYSCQDEQKYQPHRGVVARPDGQVSLFMPATTPETIGVKIVGVSPSKPSPPTASSSSAPLPDSSESKPPPPGLKSALTLCDASGQAFGVLNAAELTAFRTALGSMLLYRYRRTTERIVVFGAGQQALWHIRLALLLRGADIRAITVVNRSRARTDQLIGALELPAGVRLEAFDGDRGAAALEALVADADAIFCTTPATAPLFPAAYLASARARRKTRYVAAIGSYRLDMQELDPEFVRLVADPASVLGTTTTEDGGAATHYQGGVVAVDSRGGCLQEAGELVKAVISPDKMVEVGRLLHVKGEDGGAAELDAWLENGLVVYKSVGVGVMDIAIGRQLLDLARNKGLGVSTDF